MLLNKCKTKIGPKAKSKSVPKLKESGEKNTESIVESNKPDKEEQKDTGEGESVSEKMFVLRKQVEVMIAEGKSVDESETKIQTLKIYLPCYRHLEVLQKLMKIYVKKMKTWKLLKKQIKQ